MEVRHPSPPHIPEPLIRRAAGSVVGRYGLTTSDRLDIEQHLRAHLLQGWDGYDPTRSKPSTFADRLVSRALLTFIRDRTRRKRDPRRVVAYVGSGHYEPTTTRRDTELWVLRLDVRLAMDKLNDVDRRFAQHLMHFGTEEAARRVGLTERKARTARARIAESFRRSGLHQYVTSNGEDN